jgi:transposase-like protein
MNGTNFLLVSCLLTNRKTENNYCKWFEYLSKEGLNLSSIKVMTDLEFGIRNAGMRVWPGSTWNLCWFHVLMNSGEKMVSLKIPSQIQKILKKEISDLHERQSLDDAIVSWGLFQESLQFLYEKPLLANPIREGITKWYVKFFY